MFSSLHRTAALTLIAFTFRPASAQTFVRVTDSPVATETLNSGGATWFDADSDGHLDLFIANGNLDAQPNSLFLNDGAGGFVPAANAGDLLTDAESSIGGTVGDYDGDGDPDLFVTNRTVSLNALYRNDGGTFVRIESGDPANDVADSNTSAWVDIDSDGDLDLFVTNFNAANILYRNDGGALVRTEALPITSVVSPSINGNWADFDRDGDADYFMGNGAGPNADDVLYRNDGALSFSPLSFSDGAATLGSSWGDYDNDGDLDLFTAHFLDADNSLYRNESDPASLVPTTLPPVTSSGGQSTGSVWGDVDNDGDLDLFVANFGQDNALYLSSGPPNYTFTLAPDGPATTGGGSSFGAAMADADADGDLDLFVANQNGEANFLYENTTMGGAWLAFDLVGTPPNTTALGASVTVTAEIGGVVRMQYRQVLAHSGYNSQTTRLHVGLGDATTATVRVVWPSGAETVMENVAVNQLLTVEEGPQMSTEHAQRSEARFSVYPNPSTHAATIDFSLEQPGPVRLVVHDLLGQLVRVLVDAALPRGQHRAVWDGLSATGHPVAAGLYIISMTQNGRVQSRLLVRLR